MDFKAALGRTSVTLDLCPPTSILVRVTVSLSTRMTTQTQTDTTPARPPTRKTHTRIDRDARHTHTHTCGCTHRDAYALAQRHCRATQRTKTWTQSQRHTQIMFTYCREATLFTSEGAFPTSQVSICHECARSPAGRSQHGLMKGLYRRAIKV